MDLLLCAAVRRFMELTFRILAVCRLAALLRHGSRRLPQLASRLQTMSCLEGSRQR